MNELEKKLNQLLELARKDYNGTSVDARFWRERIGSWLFCESILIQNKVINYFEITENLQGILDKDPDFGKAIYERKNIGTF